MKTNRIRTLLTAALLSLCVSVSAYDFTVDSLYYNIVSPGKLTCEITFRSYNNKYNGDIVIPETVNYNNKIFTVVGIGSEAFYGCSELSSVTIPKTLTYIDSQAFRGCKAITCITIPGSVKYIGTMAFYECQNLNNIVFEDGDKTLEWEYFVDFTGHVCPIFYNCPIDSLYIGRNLKCTDEYYAHGLFEDSSVKKLTVGNTVTEIENYLFYACYQLNEVSLGDSVTIIGKNAFRNCENLTEISLGKSVAEIGSAALSGCENLTTIYSLNPTPPTFNSAEFTNSQYIHINVYVAKGSLTAYQTADIWKKFWNIEEYSTDTGIGNITVDGVQENKIYDLQGRKQDAPQHGINIINGKKVLVK